MDSFVLKVLKEMVAIDSFTATEKEAAGANYIHRVLSELPYFQKNPDLMGMSPIEKDYLGRDTVYGLVKGSSDKTLVLMGHYDVVGIEDYGHLAPHAFDMDGLPELLKNVALNDEARKDLESEEWLFGRGAADMKAGLAIFLNYVREYSENLGRGNVLFIAVADEESYSAGMRGAVPLLKKLKEEHGLDYSLLLDSEPARREGGKHVLPVGTGGKTLPVVVVQGEKAHIGMCFDGLNPIGVLAEIFQHTELSLEFSDVYDGEVTMPPTWNFFKDMKQTYDVSIPKRASGYFSVLSFHTTPDEILEKLKDISAKCFDSYVQKMAGIYENYKKLYKYEVNKTVSYEPYVLTFGELYALCAEKDSEGFMAFYEKLYKEVSDRIVAGELNFPQATIEIISGTLDFSQINRPVVVIGFAPPYYPAMSSRKIPGKDGKIQEYFDVIRENSLNRFKTDIAVEEYTVALSDCSYCAIDKPFDFERFSENTPMWGDMYKIDFEAVSQINVPCMVFGPWGKDYHQMTERVFRFDVTDRLPELVRIIAQYIFEKE